MHFVFYSHRRHKMSLETTGYGMDHSEDQTDGYMRDFSNRRPSDTTRYAFLQLNTKYCRDLKIAWLLQNVKSTALFKTGIYYLTEFKELDNQDQ